MLFVCCRVTVLAAKKDVRKPPYLAKAKYGLDIFNLLPSFCASILDNDIKKYASFFMPDEKICDYVWSGPNGSELLLRAMLVTVTKTMSDTQMHRSNRQYVHLWI